MLKLILNKLLTHLTTSSNYKYCYFIPFILSPFDNDNINNANPFLGYFFYMFMLNLVILICFINITGYLLAYYVLDKIIPSPEKKWINKYPVIIKILKLFYKASFLSIIIEIIVIIIIQLYLIIINFLLFINNF